MRLSKRIAAGVLAAAMSLTMLAGCSGTPAQNPSSGNNSASSSTSNSGSNNNNNNGNSNSGANSGSTSTGNTGSDIGNPGTSSGTDDTTNSIANLWQKSKSYQYGKMLNSEQVELQSEWRWIESGEVVGTFDLGYAKSGSKVYLGLEENGIKIRLVVLDGWAYGIYDNYECYIKQQVDDFEQQTMADGAAKMIEILSKFIGTGKPQSFKSESRRMGSTIYDAEDFTRTVTIEETKVKGKVSCYYTGNSLKWVTIQTDDVNFTIRIDKLMPTPNASLFQIPANYTAYIAKGNTLYDEEGNEVDISDLFS